MSGAIKIVGKDGSIRELPRAAFVAKMNENVAVITGHRPLRVVCDVCAKIITVPMAKLDRAACLSLLRSIDFKVGGKERVEALRELVDQTIADGRLTDFSKARAVPKRCEDHYRCVGWRGDCPGQRLSLIAFQTQPLKKRKGRPYRCRECEARRRKDEMTEEQREAAAARARHRLSLMTDDQRNQLRKFLRQQAAQLTPKQRRAAAKKIRSNLTEEQKARASLNLSKGKAAWLARSTNKERAQIASKASDAARRSRSHDQRSAAVKRGWETRRSRSERES